MKLWITIGAATLFLSVAFGAFGAHALKDILDDHYRGIYEKAVFYHAVHALGILLVAIIAQQQLVTMPQATTICSILLAGIVLFSGSLYALSISRIGIFGAITPLGGTAFLIAWALLAWNAAKHS